ncbi:MAG: DNA alkylation repair protein [Aliishimia sp.]
MAAGDSLKDQLFNATSVGQLAAEYEAGVPGFDGARFTQEALAGFESRELMARIDWLAECIAAQLSPDFPTMADQIEAAMPPALSADKRDDDFGQFIHAVPGILAVWHGLEAHRARALDLLHAATQRFSMEFSIRYFLIRWPEETLTRMSDWASDPHYHVRRLASEGTRPVLPWGKAVGLSPEQTLPLLDRLHGDATRFVTRSVANHLNDLSKSHPDIVLQRFEHWAEGAQQDVKELAWMRKHALRTLIKKGHPGALAALGYRDDPNLKADLRVAQSNLEIGQTLAFEAEITSDNDLPVLVDYVIWFQKANGTQAPKTFKLKTASVAAGKSLSINKKHVLRGNATTFKIYPGAHKIGLQVNGRIVADCVFDLAASA